MKAGKSETLSDIDLLQAGYRYGLSLSGNKQDAEDMVHDAWIRLIKRYRSVPDKPLLFRTIRNIFIDQVRKERVILNHRELVNLEYASIESETENSVIFENEMQIHLAKLRDVENEAIYLSIVEGYTADEIASLTKSTRGSVLSLLQRSKQKLRAWITEEDNKSPNNVVSLVSRKVKSNVNRKEDK